MSFKVRVDPKNPGHFFACCGIFELAHRLAGEAEAWFDTGYFVVNAKWSLREILETWTAARVEQLDSDDQFASPLRFGPPFDLRLDWWKDEDSGGRDLKIWAGSMQCARIQRAMMGALRDSRFHEEGVLDIGTVVYDPETEEKAEPFCFDARRAPNAHSRDIGFSPNVLKLTTTAFPAVEALAFVGLQRCRPSAIAGRRRQFEYCTWDAPMPIALAAPLVAGSVRSPGTRRFRFDLYFRTDYLKAFRPAVLIDNGESPNA